MPELPVSAEMVEFAANIAQGTFSGTFEWETTADEDTLITPLGGAYTAMLLRTYALDDDTGSEYRVYDLALLKAGKELFRLSPSVLHSSSFARHVNSRMNAFEILERVWATAILKATKVTDELNAVNSLLRAKLKAVPPMAEESVEDDDVPF